MDRTETHQPNYGQARGGFSLGSILTGVAVAFGAMVLLSAVIGAIALAAGGLDELATADAVEVGWGLGIGFVVAQFLSYLWGGYTAGRMARGAGGLNGFLVPLAALVIVAAAAGIVGALGGANGFAYDMPAGARLPVGDGVVRLGMTLGIASLLAMFIGGLIGGMMGARWHDKLEAKPETHIEPEHRAAA